MTWHDLLVFLGGSAVGSGVTTVAIAMCIMRAKADDQKLDGQQQWRDDVRRLLKEKT